MKHLPQVFWESPNLEIVMRKGLELGHHLIGQSQIGPSNHVIPFTLLCHLDDPTIHLRND